MMCKNDEAAVFMKGEESSQRRTQEIISVLKSIEWNMFAK